MNPDLLAVFAQRLAPMILLVYLLAICLEMLIDRVGQKKVYKLYDTIQNIGIFFVNRMTGTISGLYFISILSITQHFVPWKINCPGSFFITFIIVDALFYAQHYSFHRNPLLAAFHEVHHSSQEYNFTTTLRASFLLPSINPFFYIPAILLGCDALTVILAFTLIQVFQFFLHTQFIPTLGFLEGFINTPSAHRVHHGNLASQYESNIGGVFLIWDRIFGTYAAEHNEIEFGVKGVAREGFVAVQLRPFVALYQSSIVGKDKSIFG